MHMFVVYSNSTEVLITTQKLEDAMLKEWFTEETGRRQEDYDRVWSSDTAVAVRISPRVDV